MLWLILCILAALAWSISAFIDNYQTDVIFRGKTPQAMKVLNGPTYIAIAIIAGIVMQVQLPGDFLQIALLLLAGAFCSVGALAYYQALETEESTGVAIFYQLQPVLMLIADYFIFGENITIQQILGFIIILTAPVVVIASRRRAKSRHIALKTAGFMIIHSIFAVISAEICTRSSSGMDFRAIFILYIFGRGLTDCLLGFIPKYYKRHKYILKRQPAAYVGSVVINQTICAFADCAYRYGLILGFSAIVSAVANAAELIITFTLGIIISIIWPVFGREKLHRHIIVAHLIAVILCVVGIIIIQ